MNVSGFFVKRMKEGYVDLSKSVYSCLDLKMYQLRLYLIDKFVILLFHIFNRVYCIFMDFIKN